MIEWDEWSEADAAARWDSAIVQFPDYSIYQAYGWGEYKRRGAWSVIRGTIVGDGTPLGLAQCLVRTIPVLRLAVVWVPGGPAGRPSARFGLAEALHRRFRGWSLTVRANVVAERRPENEAGMTAAGWRPAGVRVGHPTTFVVDLAGDDEARRAALAGNWRHNLRRGQARAGTIVIWGADERLDDVHRVYREMTALKGIAASLDLGDLGALQKGLGHRFMLAAAVDGALTAIRGCGRIGDAAYDLMAAVTPPGRKIYASYAVTWALLEAARADGARRYDLSGADPVAAPGVYNFKKGLGGRQVDMVGEWEWTTSPALRWALRGALTGLRLGAPTR